MCFFFSIALNLHISLSFIISARAFSSSMPRFAAMKEHLIFLPSHWVSYALRPPARTHALILTSISETSFADRLGCEKCTMR